MRTKGAKTKKNCWRVTIKQGEIILHFSEYKTLKDAGEDLGLTYSQICELGPSPFTSNSIQYSEVKIPKF